MDFYKILGIDKSSSSSDIKKAYRKLALKYHPDKNPGDAKAEAKFKEISEAYQVLSDDQKRASYDRMGHSNFKQNGSQGSGSHGFDFNSSDIFGNFSDIFGDFFGEGFSQGFTNRKTKGSDLRHDLTITLEEVVKGATKDIQFERTGNCTDCRGTGAKNSKLKKCPKCHGAGQIKTISKSIFGQFVNVQPCGNCKGTGQIPDLPCEVCLGTGVAREIVKTKINIPKGIDSGARIKISNYGEASRDGGPLGDLYIFVKVEDHKFFKREGRDLICEVPVDFTIAALGGEIDIPTIDGKIKMKIPEGSQSGKKFRLKGRGISSSNYSSGDQIVSINVAVPNNLSASQKKSLKDFYNSLSPNNNDVLEKFNKKMGN